MLIEHGGKRPTIDPSARIAPNATICGDVTIGVNTSVGFGVVVTAESGPVRVGRNCVIMETAVLRGVRNSDLEIGDNVLIGPRCHLSGCRIEDEVFVATGATVLNGAHLGKGCEVRINGSFTSAPASRRMPSSPSAGSPSAARHRCSRQRITPQSGPCSRASISRVRSSASRVPRPARRSWAM